MLPSLTIVDRAEDPLSRDETTAQFQPVVRHDVGWHRVTDDLAAICLIVTLSQSFGKLVRHDVTAVFSH